MQRHKQWPLKDPDWGAASNQRVQFNRSDQCNTTSEFGNEVEAWDEVDEIMPEGAANPACKGGQPVSSAEWVALLIARAQLNAAYVTALKTENYQDTMLTSSMIAARSNGASPAELAELWQKTKAYQQAPGASRAPSVEPLLCALNAATPSQNPSVVPTGIKQMMTSLAGAAAKAPETTAGPHDD
ncbi:hypothetical protein JCM8202_006009 [Rhodotorula sphaerocarpa]